MYKTKKKKKKKKHPKKHVSFRLYTFVRHKIKNNKPHKDMYSHI